ncbi:MAG: IS1182 family transposase, partial [Actinomycetota bacterium]|nr:IS1182 family transposase [Actinomycetota bacterium]
MMGTKVRSFSPLPRNVSLEELVPADHFYRRLDAEIDLSFVRELVAPLYAGGGRPSVDPVVFFKLQLVMFFEALRSERQLMRVVADRLSLRWYLGYDLFESLPDHSSLTRIRERYGLEVFRGFFERIVEMCVEAGLVWGEELFVDSTTVRANAAKAALVPRFAARKHLDGLFGEEPAGATGETGGGADASLPGADDEELETANAARRDFFSSAGRHGTKSRTPNPNKISDQVVNRTDPDACLVGQLKGTARMGYKAHYVVDGGKARVILTALVSKADVKDNQPMLDLVWHTTFRWKLKPHHVTGDSVYGTIPNVKALEQAGIRAYMPVIDYTWGKRTLFRKDDFAYDAERDVYRCPAGEVLRNTGARKKLRLTRYVADPEVCNACPLKSSCTEGKSGRAVNRNFDEEYFEKVKGYYGLEAYKKAMRKRKVWVEPMFAEAKQWHGMDRVRLRTLERVNTEVLVTAAGQNLKRLLGFGPRRPRTTAQAAALRPPGGRCLSLLHRRRATRRGVSQHAAGILYGKGPPGIAAHQAENLLGQGVLRSSRLLLGCVLGIFPVHESDELAVRGRHHDGGGAALPHALGHLPGRG